MKNKMILLTSFIIGGWINVAMAYTPPTGIPAPSFGIDNVAPAQPANWPAAETTDYYYIDSDHTSATDTNNDYGYPDQPRLTIPYGTFTAGSYIEVAPSTSNYSGGTLRFDCSLDQPCWLRGADQANMPTFDSLLILQQGQYAIIENLNFNSSTERVGIALGHPGGGYSTSHYSIRNNTITNNGSVTSSSYALGFYPGSNSTITDIVFYNNTVTDSQTELGVSAMDGMRITSRDGGDERIWILENTFITPSNYGIQIKGPNNVYAGKNVVTRPYLAGISVEGAADSIISQNTVSGARQSTGGAGSGVGIYYRYVDDNLWFIYNRLYDNSRGIAMGSIRNDSNRVFMVGNWIYDNFYDGGENNSSPGIQGSGGVQIQIVDNVIHNTRGGIILGSDNVVVMANNLMTDIYGKRHLHGSNASKGANASIQNTFFGEAATIWWNNGDHTNLNDFTAANPTLCVTCQESIDPLYIDSANADPSLKNFGVQNGSPVIAQSSEHAVYQTFITEFGRDIRVDFEGEPRPTNGGKWDLGADQFFNTTIAPVIGNTSLDNATQYINYSQGLSNADGKAPFTWSLDGGTLPGGMTLNGDGVISGINTIPDTYNFTIKVTDDNAASDTQALSITVDPAPPISITNSSLSNAVINTAYSDTLTGNGGNPAYTWALISGSLPAGISLSTTGKLSGTPTESGTFSPTFEITDQNGSTSNKQLSITIFSEVTIDASSLLNATRDAFYSETLKTSAGTAPFTWSVDTLPDGLSLSSSGVLSGTPTTLGSVEINITVTDANSSTQMLATTMTVLTPKVDIQTTSLSNGDKYQAYSATFIAVDGTPPYHWGVSDGALPNGLNLSSEGLLSGTPDTFGSFDFTLQVTDANSDTKTISYTLMINPAPLALNTIGLSDAEINQLYSADLTLMASEGTAPYAWTTTDTFPDGITLTNSGILSGTPTELGNYFLSIKVIDSAGKSVDKLIGFSVIETLEPLSIITKTLDTATINTPYSFNLSVEGGSAPYQWTLASGDLPSGMSFDSDGVLTGTTDEAGTFQFSLRVTDDAGKNKNKNFALIIKAPATSTKPSGSNKGLLGASLNNFGLMSLILLLLLSRSKIFTLNSTITKVRR